MEIYYTTYLCIGTFIDKHNISIARKIKIAINYPIIDADEWDRGFIKKDELEKYLMEKCDKDKMCELCFIIPENIQLIQTDGRDLFIEESYDIYTNDVYKETFSEYILVEKNYMYTINDS